MRQRTPLLPTVLILLATTVAAQAPTPAAAEPAGWEQLAFLLGDWDGLGVGAPGGVAGGFSLRPDLDSNILVRRIAADTPGGHHDDLMIIYHAAPDTVRAIYFDNEGHVIDYTLAPAPGPGQATFVSRAAAGRPRFRLGYRLNDDDTVSIDFAVQPPDAAGFQTYFAGTARRRPAAGGQ